MGKQVVITLTDDELGENVDVVCEFGEGGADDDSAAHQMAVMMLKVVGGEVGHG